MDSQTSWVEAALSGMDDAHLVGQMLSIGFEGPEAPPEVREWVAAGRAGSIILFAHNIVSPAQVAELTASLQSLSPVPLLFLIDQEGGIVTRLHDPATVMPGQMALGATFDPQNAHRAATILAREMRALGLHVNLAPVLDIQTDATKAVMGIRSFGETAEMVRDFGLAALSAYQESGILACVKHFPGKGDSNLDSHLYLPTIPHSRERMAQVELVPFKAAIDAGAGMVMTSHVLFPAYDAELPATLSPRVLRGLLRDGLGFQGLIATDALEMKAIADHFPAGRSGVLAALAGADLLLAPHGFERQQEISAAVLDALRSGELPRPAVEQSVRRILAAKWRYAVAVDELYGPRPPLEAVGCAEHRQAARALADASITLVRNEAGLVPLRLPAGARLAVIDFSLPRFSLVEEARRTARLLHSEVQARHPQASLTSVTPQPTPAERDQCRAAAAAADVLLLFTRNADQYPEQASLVQELAATRPAAVVAMRNPFDLLAFPAVATYVAAYGDASVTIGAVVRGLFGEVPFAGRLPVSLPGLYPRGHGLRSA